SFSDEPATATVARDASDEREDRAERGSGRETVRALIPAADVTLEDVAMLDPAMLRHDTPLLPAAPLAPRGATRATLTLMSGADAGRSVAIDEEEVLIGRDHAVHLHLDDAGVSRKHARVMRAPDGSYVLQDLNSTNGTFVGGHRVVAVALNDGDYVQIG